MPTWTGLGADNNWSTALNWDTGVPTLAQPAIFSGNILPLHPSNKNVTITFGATCSNIDFTGYLGQATFTNTLTIRGSGVNLGTTATFAGSAGITINSVVTASFTSNSRPFNQPIIYNSNGTGGFTHTYDNWSISSFTTNFFGGTSVTIGGSSTITLTGSMSIAQILSAPTTTFRLTGTGTLSSNVNCSALIRIDSGVNTTTVSNLTLNNGSLTYVSGVISASGLLTTVGTCNLDLQNQLFSNYQQNNSTIVTLLSDANFNNVTTGLASGTSLVLNGIGQRLKVRGNYTFSQTNADLTGTVIISLIGSGNINFTQTRSVNVDFEINTVGSYTFISNSFFGGGGKTFTHTNGLVNAGLFTVTFGVASPTSATYTLNVSNINWNNVIFLANANSVNTLSLPLIVTNNLTLNGTTNFLGAAGWTTNDFTHGGAASICTLQAGNTYTVNRLFTMNGTSSASRAVLQSNDAVVVTASIASLSNQLVVTAGSPVNPATGYVLGSTSTALPAALNNLLPDRPTILSGSASPYTLVNPIGVTPLASGSYTLGKKAFFIVTNGTGSTNVSNVITRDIDSNGGITILAFNSYSDAIGQPSANLFRTLNWGPLIAPSSSSYFTFVN